MTRFFAILSSLLLLTGAVFAGFGYLATFEPTDNVIQFMAFRIGYTVVGLSCLVGVGLVIANAFWK